MRIDGPWRTNPATQAVFSALQAGGGQAYFVGGCVRNALINAPVLDIDIATDATPKQVKELAKVAGLTAIPTGIDHGTITVVSASVRHEVTTFRKDVETDGRRAVVDFSTDMAEDAARRDFTMNALYAAADGTIHDPLGGIEDLKARRVRFIGDANKRIQEDYLRSLRFFRFNAWYADPSEGMDANALNAIARNLDGLEALSRERVSAELMKLLSAADPSPALATMQQIGMLQRILPGADAKSLAPLVHLEADAGVTPSALRRLGVLSPDNVADDLRLSRAEERQFRRLTTSAKEDWSPAETGYRLGAEDGLDALLMRSAWLAQPVDDTQIQSLISGSKKTFPVKSTDLMPQYQGPALGAVLAQLTADWIASGFTMTRETLLKTVL